MMKLYCSVHLKSQEIKKNHHRDVADPILHSAGFHGYQGQVVVQVVAGWRTDSVQLNISR